MNNIFIEDSRTKQYYVRDYHRMHDTFMELELQAVTITAESLLTTCVIPFRLYQNGFPHCSK